ncbi:hypothetical protein C1645_855031 [Glomus cerebriforme]|uniref:Uncharacterized protein n=1 Tax=Glomus cerebriforme TaxID=658196 RepID=A0A397SR33_9GLOM|nr:hypothetical protein C1645_855031 [Glomus cerebriforme]
MDETYNNDFYQQFQISRNRNAVWNDRDYDGAAGTSSNLINHCMGRHQPYVEILYQKEKNVASLSHQQEKTPEKNNHDGNRPGFSSNNYKLHVFASSNDFQENPKKNKKGKKKRKKKTIPDEKGCESIHDIQQQQAGSELESRKNTNIAVVSSERYPNKSRTREIETPLGELCRVGFLVGTSRATWTTEGPTTLCHLVHPNRFLTQKNESHAPKLAMYNVSKGNGPYETSNARNSSFMLVEKIKNEYDRHRVATSVSHNILSESEESDLHDLTDDMESIKKFGFDHIIIVGERDYGILFLDCYGRMFDWDHINLLLWPLGNYLEYKLNKPRVAWVVEFNGTITEFEADLDLDLDLDLYLDLEGGKKFTTIFFLKKINKQYGIVLKLVVADQYN